MEALIPVASLPAAVVGLVGVVVCLWKRRYGWAALAALLLLCALFPILGFVLAPDGVDVGPAELSR